jgi:hypothetical protein
MPAAEAAAKLGHSPTEHLRTYANVASWTGQRLLTRHCPMSVGRQRELRAAFRRVAGLEPSVCWRRSWPPLPVDFRVAWLDFFVV